MLQSITLERIPLEDALKHSAGIRSKAYTGIRSKAFHWNTLESIPLEYTRKHSTGIRSNAFHWNTLESILLEYARMHSTAKAFHCNTLESIYRKILGRIFGGYVQRFVHDLFTVEGLRRKTSLKNGLLISLQLSGVFKSAAAADLLLLICCC